MAVDRLLPHLPDDIVHKIFQLIPIKLAMRSTIFSKRWASLWPLGLPLFDFDDDEGESSDHDADNLVRNKLLFMDFVEICLTHCEKQELDSFRLRMRYDYELKTRATRRRIDEWFSFVVDRCVKELDINIRRKDDNTPGKNINEFSIPHRLKSRYYCIPKVILNSQFLTSLNLEHVMITISKGNRMNLPLLKTMSLKAVLFDVNMDDERLFWMDCPSIEHLSLASCSASFLYVINSNLKVLQVMDCKIHTFIVGGKNLESLTFTSQSSYVRHLQLLSECVNLKCINIVAQHLESLDMYGLRGANLKATIDTPNLEIFFYNDFLLPGDVISMRARDLDAALIYLHRNGHSS